MQAADPRATSIDGGGAVRPLDISILDAEVLIEKLRITNGRAVNEGGGLRAQLGGTGVLELKRVVVDNNLVTGSNSNTGGGLMVRSLGDSRFELQDSEVSNNVVGLEPNGPAGGGLGAFSGDRAMVRILGNQIEDNRLVDAGQNTGSAVYWDGLGDSRFEFSDNVVRNNTCTGASCIGAITLWASGSTQLEARRNIVVSNTAPNAVGGSQASLIAAGSSTFLLTDSLVAGGFDVGVSAWSNQSGRLELINSTIVDHAGAGLLTRVFENSGSLIVGNTILRNNAGGEQLDPATVLVSNLIGIDPEFVNAATGDYRLREDSPARDAGSNSIAGLGATDLDGKPRVLAGSVDIGAYEFESGSTVPCSADDQTHCLLDGRFEVSVLWQDFQGGVGSGAPVPTARILLPSDDSGLFYFFDEDNWEMLVKVIDACSLNQHFWLFGAATTNVGYELTVRDTQSGEVVRYANPLGQRSPAITDVEAFSTCP